MKSRSAWLLGFFAVLHAMVLFGMWRGSQGRIAGGVVLFSVIPLVMAGAYLLERVARPMSWLDMWVAAYGGWSALSIVLYLQAANPSAVGAYPYGLYHFVLPIACYYAVKLVPREQRGRLIDGFVILNAFAVTYGIYLYAVRPEFYLSWLQQRLTQPGALEEWQFFARLQSYLGSTSVGYLSATSLVLATLMSTRLSRLTPVLVPLFVAGVALSLQRASMVGGVLALVYLAFLARGRAAMRWVMLASVAGAGVYAMIRLEQSAIPLRETLQTRVTSDMVEGAAGFLGDRGYGPGLKYLQRFPLGVGVGGTSSAADQAGFASQGEVPDANFMRIAADLGVPGLLIFLLVIATGFTRAQQSRQRAAWTTFLVIHVGVMLSTNVFDSFYISHSFWALLAIIDSDDAHPAEARAGIPAAAVASPTAAYP